MPRPIRVKLRAEQPICVAMDNSFNQDPIITDEKVFNNSTSSTVLSQIIISGPLDGYKSPLVIQVTNNVDPLTVTLVYEDTPPDNPAQSA